MPTPFDSTGAYAIPVPRRNIFAAPTAAPERNTRGESRRQGVFDAPAESDSRGLLDLDVGQDTHRDATRRSVRWPEFTVSTRAVTRLGAVGVAAIVLIVLLSAGGRHVSARPTPVVPPVRHVPYPGRQQVPATPQRPVPASRHRHRRASHANAEPARTRPRVASSTPRSAPLTTAPAPARPVPRSPAAPPLPKRVPPGAPPEFM